MPIYDYECRKCGAFEAMATAEDRKLQCKCGREAERVWLSRGERRMLERPIVLHRYADGQWGVPGRDDAPTPAGAERVEIRSMAEYNKVVGRMNLEERARHDRRDEAVMEAREQAIKLGRERLITRMRETDSELGRDLIRHALAKYDTAARDSTFRPFYAEAMEMDASNRDGYYERLSRDRK